MCASPLCNSVTHSPDTRPENRAAESEFNTRLASLLTGNCRDSSAVCGHLGGMAPLHAQGLSNRSSQHQHDPEASWTRTARPRPDPIQQGWHQPPEFYLLPNSQVTPMLPALRPAWASRL